ncbi:MAG: transcriptional regulator, partial [Bacteroidales bacterium]|nr:transcriptional regulator [Bacteroidales bacterium]
RVKEQYIISFLESLSNQIHLFREEDNRQRNLLKRGRTDQLLKDLADSSRSEKARGEFYQTFDATFLAMYPDFVERFNGLLQEEARIHPPKGKLTTELRIFALIRLGVDDSKRIAEVLDYSLSTIYNYKVSVKNHALGDRDQFEEQVKMIGK